MVIDAWEHAHISSIPESEDGLLRGGRLDPGSAIIATDLGGALLLQGREAEAEEVFNEVLEGVHHDRGTRFPVIVCQAS